MRRQIFMILLGLVLLAALLGGCKPVTAPAAAPAEPATAAAATPEAAQEGVGMTNPASVYCEQNGGKLEIRDESGGQVGYCMFGDGSECEEWAYMRGECAPGEAKGSTAIGMPNPASVFCTDNGGTLEMRKDAGGGEYGMCVFSDGSECEEWAYFRGECKPGEATPVGQYAQSCVRQLRRAGRYARDSQGCQWRRVWHVRLRRQYRVRRVGPPARNLRSRPKPGLQVNLLHAGDAPHFRPSPAARIPHLPFGLIPTNLPSSHPRFSNIPPVSASTFDASLKARVAVQPAGWGLYAAPMRPLPIFSSQGGFQ